MSRREVELDESSCWDCINYVELKRDGVQCSCNTSGIQCDYLIGKISNFVSDVHASAEGGCVRASD